MGVYSVCRVSYKPVDCCHGNLRWYRCRRDGKWRVSKATRCLCASRRMWILHTVTTIIAAIQTSPTTLAIPLYTALKWRPWPLLDVGAFVAVGKSGDSGRGLTANKMDYWLCIVNQHIESSLADRGCSLYGQGLYLWQSLFGRLIRGGWGPS